MSRMFSVVRTLIFGTIFLSIWFYWLPLWFAHIERVPLLPQNRWAWLFLGIGFALWMFISITQEWSFWWGFGTLVIAVVILLYLMLETFLNRQFT